MLARPNYKLKLLRNSPEMCEVPNYRIEKDERLGRYLVANKPLKKGTLVFTDVPFALGPKPGRC